MSERSPNGGQVSCKKKHRRIEVVLLFRIKLMHPQNLIISILWNSERISDFGEFAVVSHFFQKVRKLVESFSWRSFFMANRQLNKLGIVTGVAKSAVASFVRTVANAAASSSFSSLPPNSGTGKKQGRRGTTTGPILFPVLMKWSSMGHEMRSSYLSGSLQY